MSTKPKEDAIFIQMSSSWRLVVLRGVLAIAFGLAALVWSRLTVGALVILFGIFALMQGTLAVAAAIKDRDRGRWWLLLLEGIAGILIGFCAFLWPALTAVALLVIIAVWAIVTGIFEIALAVQIRKEVTGEWLLALAGILSVLIGVMLMANPGAGALALVWLIGVYAIMFGILLVFLGFRLRRTRL
jgi:uncharacterized membrane protein HdeD (DUF308 family)